MKNYNLDRFISAQKYDFEAALSEIKAGKKQSHWIWYVFPQLKGLGCSGTSYFYGIENLEEAKAYIEHPVLRERLIEITKALLSLEESDPYKIMGYPDNLKLCSCMTLFEAAAPEIPGFALVLEKLYAGKKDERTVDLLKRI